MIVALGAKPSKAAMPPPPLCAHRWTRRADLDPNIDTLAYRCDLCGAVGERRFGERAEIRVVEPNTSDYWHHGRVRTERDRQRSIYSQLGVDDLIDGEALTLAEVIQYRRPKRGRIPS
jgi:hypothetical protein